ncbi:MAG: hypothetical protein WKF75_17950, partial [Singulisphaera sp.]
GGSDGEHRGGRRSPGPRERAVGIEDEVHENASRTGGEETPKTGCLVTRGERPPNPWPSTPSNRAHRSTKQADLARPDQLY